MYLLIKLALVSVQGYYCKRTFTFAGMNKKRDSARGHNKYRVVIQNRSTGTVDIPQVYIYDKLTSLQTFNLQ